jgi:hypothetical protein
MTNFLSIIDSFHFLLDETKIPPYPIIYDTIGAFLQSCPDLPKEVILIQQNLKLLFLLSFERLRLKSSFEEISLIIKQGQRLSLTLALSEDSSAFNTFFLKEVLPRYLHHIPPSTLMTISEGFELAEETLDFLSHLQSTTTIKETEETSETVKIICKDLKTDSKPSATLPFKDKKVNIQRNLTSGSKKKVLTNARLNSSTPTQNDKQISNEARKLKDYNQEFFYGKKLKTGLKVTKLSSLNESHEIRESEGDILVMRTPTKNEDDSEEELWMFKSVFHV